MLLDDYSIIIIAESIGLDERGVSEYVFKHFSHIFDLTTAETLAYLAENDEEKMQEMEDMINQAKTADAKNKATKMIQEQIKLTLASYPDLQELIEERINEFDHEVFFSFVETGPVDGIMQLLEYMQDKLKAVDKYQKVQEILQKRTDKNDLKKFLE